MRSKRCLSVVVLIVVAYVTVFSVPAEVWGRNFKQLAIAIHNYDPYAPPPVGPVDLAEDILLDPPTEHETEQLKEFILWEAMMAVDREEQEAWIALFLLL